MNINWDDGRIIILNAGDIATNQKLNQQQLYGLIFYNSAQNDVDAIVNVVWSNSQPPVKITVPGTTGNKGLASVFFINGSDTTTISTSLSPQNQPGVQIQAYIASVKMPTNTSGISNISLPLDGTINKFNGFTRYYCVPESHWYEGQIQSNVNQFISIQFQEQKAIVNVVNCTSDPNLNVFSAGTAKNQFTINSDPYQNLTWNLQGNGSQFVWVNADSIQNSTSATISIQSLSGLYETLN